MKNRFEGEKGKRILIETIKECDLVKHDKNLAEKLAEIGEVIEFKEKEIFIEEGDDDNDAYIILAGKADVSIKGNSIGTREAGEIVGEMVIINPSEPRSATLKAINKVVALRVSEPEFTNLANEHPQIWKFVAEVNADRLRQRSKFITRSNENPILFIGCSTESLEIAEAIELGLDHAPIEVVIWTNGVFTASEPVIEDLKSIANEADFALFLFSADDKLRSRKKEYDAPRDNTIFELGFFMGKLERKRTFIVRERSSNVKIPSDLLGITDMTFDLKKSRNLTTAVSTVCTQLKQKVKELGPR